jgi:hypothetical protein
VSDGPKRFCQCGKPAGHDSVCNLEHDGDREVERIDRASEDVLSDRAAKRWERRKPNIDEERRQARARMTPLELHRHAVERATTISTVAGGNVEPSRGHGDSALPPSQQLLDDDPRWREHEAVIRSRLLRLHELLDEAEGLGPVAATTKMLGEEKDERIRKEGEGLSAIGVVELLGRDIAGSPETVRRVRKAAGRSTKDGRRIDAPDTSGMRRVRIDDR